MAINDDLNTATQASAAGKEAESQKSELEPIKAKRDQTKPAYAAKRDDLYQRWSGQLAELMVLRKHIRKKFPKWPDLIETFVCPLKFATDKSLPSVVRARRGKNERKVASTSDDLTVKKAKLDAWLSLDQWLTAQLDKVDKGIKEIQALDGKPDEIATLYIFFFEVAPTHRNMRPSDVAAPAHGAEEEASVTALPDCLPGDDPDRVYLVELGGYEGEVDDAWDAFKLARKAKQDAESEFKDEPDDLAARLKVLKARTDGLRPDAIKALKEYPWKQQPQPQPPQQPPPQRQQPEQQPPSQS